ncbi:MAG: SspB family protein [Magnetovibrionaceae bacterium]
MSSMGGSDDFGSDGGAIGPDDPLRYDKWIEDALRGVIKRSLSFVAENGLMGEHHFYITFRTGHDGVAVPGALRAQHPHEMTIVLQNQFWDLGVGEESFTVTLRFSGKSERLVIPFEAISAFADPSVNFGLQLKVLGDDELDDDDFDETEALVEMELEVEEMLDAEASASSEPKTGEVIALDAFRKK